MQVQVNLHILQMPPECIKHEKGFQKRYTALTTTVDTS